MTPPVSEPFCSRCLEDFPIDADKYGWSLGYLRPLSKAPQWIQSRFAREDPEGQYFCGNCYFDCTDEE